MSDITISELRARRQILEDKIAALVSAFELTNNVTVVDICITTTDVGRNGGEGTLNNIDILLEI